MDDTNPYAKYAAQGNPYAKYAPAPGNDEQVSDKSPFSLGGEHPNAVERGFLKAGINVDQLINKTGLGAKIGLPTNEQYAQATKTLNKQGEGKGLLSAVGEIAGNPANLAGIALPIGRLGNAATGALSALSEPTTGDPENYGREKVGQATRGAIEGLFGGEAARGLAKLAAPTFGKAVDLLSKEGVEMTPATLASGMFKGAVKRGESALASVPVLGSFIQNAENKSLESFNKAVVNRVLKPLGDKLPDNVNVGRDSIDYAKNAIGKAYDRLMPHVSFQPDTVFADGVKDLNDNVISRLTPDAQKHFSSLFDNILGSRLQQNGGKLDGKTFKTVESELAYESRTYMKSLDPVQKRLGEAIDDFRGLLKENLARMNPKYAKELSKTDAAWAAYIRARDASIRTVKSGEREIGTFSPADLLREIKGKTSKGSFASGNGLMQDLAEAGAQVLPATVRDSGSVERGLWAMLAGGGGAALAGHPGVAAAGAMGALPYTKPGMAVVNKWAQGASSKGLRKALENVAPEAALGASNIPLGQNNQ